MRLAKLLARRGVKMASSAGQGVELSLQRAPTCQMKAPWTDPSLRELLALAALAAFGCGLALAQRSSRPLPLQAQL
jgi:hypothetical protein